MEQNEPVQAQLQPEDKRRALFAAVGERVYLIEKMHLELNAIRAELDKDQPTYPPKTPAPAVETPDPNVSVKETAEPTPSG